MKKYIEQFNSTLGLDWAMHIALSLQKFSRRVQFL